MAATAIDLQPCASLNDDDGDREALSVRARRVPGARLASLGHCHHRGGILGYADFTRDPPNRSQRAAASDAGQFAKSATGAEPRAQRLRGGGLNPVHRVALRRVRDV